MWKQIINIYCDSSLHVTCHMLPANPTWQLKAQGVLDHMSLSVIYGARCLNTFPSHASSASYLWQYFYAYLCWSRHYWLLPWRQCMPSWSPLHICPCSPVMIHELGKVSNCLASCINILSYVLWNVANTCRLCIKFSYF